MKLGVISMGMAVGLGVLAVGLSTFAGLGIAATQDLDGAPPGAVQETQRDGRTRIGNETDDKILASKVIVAINSEPGMTDGTYSVRGTTAKDGVVTLVGNMPTEARKKRCEEIAKGVSGVKSVVNKITTPPPDKDGGK